MKNYEKLYKEAIERCKSWIRGEHPECFTEAQKAGEFIFPELKESEDERIRKDIVEYLKSQGASKRWDFNTWIAWLEKQGEQKTEIKYVYPKFRIGDVIVEIKPNGSCPPVRVKYIGEGSYSCKSDDGKRFLSIPIRCEDEYKLIEQKPAWSEEDEKKMNKLVSLCIGFQNSNTQLYSVSLEFQELIDWLKSLKSKSNWKPSEQNIKDLEWCADLVQDKMGVGFHRLQVFIDELKNL